MSGQEGENTPLRTERLLWGVALAALVADVALTAYGLTLDLHELNPVGRFTYRVGGVGGLFLAKLLVVGFSLALRPLVPASFRAVVPASLAIPWLTAGTLNALAVVAVH